MTYKQIMTQAVNETLELVGGSPKRAAQVLEINVNTVRRYMDIKYKQGCTGRKINTIRILQTLANLKKINNQ